MSLDLSERFLKLASVSVSREPRFGPLDVARFGFGISLA